MYYTVLVSQIQGGSNMTGTDLCVNICQSRSYLNHLVVKENLWMIFTNLFSNSDYRVRIV